jgi:pilus assembly protein CpaF
VHANAARDVPARLAALGALAGLSRAAVSSQVIAAIDVVVHLVRAAGTRRVEEIGFVRPEGDDVTVVPAWSVGAGRLRGADPLAARLSQRGAAVPDLLR